MIGMHARDVDVWLERARREAALEPGEVCTPPRVAEAQAFITREWAKYRHAIEQHEQRRDWLAAERAVHGFRGDLQIYYHVCRYCPDNITLDDL